MGFINQFPYSDAHELNLDWLIKTVKELGCKMDDFEAANKLNYAGAWSIAKQYSAWTVVTDSNFAYISVKPVPAGIDISNSEYWQYISNLTVDSQARSDIADLNTEVSALNAKFPITRSELAPDKYLFIGDSWNAAGHHNGWAYWIADHIGLTENTDYWSVAVSGGGMGNGLLLPAVQSKVSSLTASQKASITKVLIVSGCNEWAQTNSDIDSGVRAMENYLTAQLPNAEIYLVAAQWMYFDENQARQGLLNGYNRYALTTHYMKFIDKAYPLFMDPYFLESDMVHPTESGQKNLAWTLINILKGGNVWNRYYDGLNAKVTMVSAFTSTNFYIYGNISENGTHIWKNDVTGIQTPLHTPITITHSGTKIGEIDSTHNNLFQQHCIIPIVSFCRYDIDNESNYGIFKGRLEIVKQENDMVWDVILRSDSFLAGESYDIDLTALYLTFNMTFDPCMI